MEQKVPVGVHNAYSELNSARDSLDVVMAMCKNVDVNTATGGLAFQDAVHGLVGNVLGYLDSGIEGISSEFPDVEEKDREDPEETIGDPVLQAVPKRERSVEEVVNASFYELSAFLEMADRGWDAGVHAGTVPVAQTLLEKAKKDITKALSNGKASEETPSQDTPEA